MYCTADKQRRIKSVLDCGFLCFWSCFSVFLHTRSPSKSSYLLSFIACCLAFGITRIYILFEMLSLNSVRYEGHSERIQNLFINGRQFRSTGDDIRDTKRLRWSIEHGSLFFGVIYYCNLGLGRRSSQKR